MEISYLGHSSFRIKTKTATVITDPFDPNITGFKFPRIDADIVTISHQHEDHNRYDLVKDAKKVFSGPGEYESQGVSILGYSTNHDGKDGKERGINTVYVYEAENLRIAHLGDLGEKLSSSLLEEIGDINVLLIPVGGFFTIGPVEAAEISRSIQPQITIPMHYKTPELNPANFSKLVGVEDFLKELNLPVENLDKLNVKEIDLIDVEKAVVLKRRE